MDNPGWHVKANFGATESESTRYEHAEYYDDRFLLCIRAADGKFEGFGDPGRLREILRRLVEVAQPEGGAPRTFPSLLQSSTLTRLCAWYIDKCDFDWEHIFGITIRGGDRWTLEWDDESDTIANTVSQGLASTSIKLATRPSNSGMVAEFSQSGGPSLEELIRAFLQVQLVPAEIPNDVMYGLW